MGREKRVAESRAKEVLAKAQSPEPGRTGFPGASTGTAAPVVSPSEQQYMGAGQAVLRIFLLFLIPTLLILAVGKLLLGL